MSMFPCKTSFPAQWREGRVDGKGVRASRRIGADFFANAAFIHLGADPDN
jgi:hypothetical protein